MPYPTRSYVTVVCDVCARPLEYDDDATAHYDTADDARREARIYGWLAAPDQAVCPEADGPHRDAVDALMPPEPPAECDGQLTLTEEIDQ